MDVKIEFDNDESSIEAIVIKKGSIKELSWTDPNYVEKLMKLDLFKTIPITKENLIDQIGINLEIDKYKENTFNIKTEYIVDEYDLNNSSNVYEIMYIDFSDNTEYIIDDNLNELATLYNINGEKIYSNVLIFKNNIKSLTDIMVLSNIDKTDLHRILYQKVYTKVVLWNDDIWYEENIIGDLNIFAKKFFDEDNYIKIEIPFLMYYLHIWFTSDYGQINICGKLINKPIEKCIIFIMKSEEYRGCITLEEVKKIIYLSNKLDNFSTPVDLLTDRFDKYDRKIIINKYKILDYLYNIN